MAKKTGRPHRKEQNKAPETTDIEQASIPNSAEMKREDARFTNLILGVFLGIAAVLILIASIMAVNISRAHASEIRVQGEVVDLMITTGENGEEFYFPVVEFPILDGTRQTVQVSQGSSTLDYKRGESVTILYDPQNLEDARIRSLGSTALRWLGPVLIGFIGAVFLGITAFAWTAIRRQDETLQEEAE